MIDEWQEAPVLWDAVRTGRISRLKMYPMTLYESQESNGEISLRKLFDNDDMDIDGIMSQMTVEDLMYAACRGG